MKVLSYIKKHKVITTVASVVVVSGVVGAVVLANIPRGAKVAQVNPVVTEQTEQETPVVEDVDTNVPEQGVAPTTSPSPSVEPSPEPISVYEKYDVDEAVANKFEFYYPTFSNHDHDAFISMVAKITDGMGNEKAILIIDGHAKSTGLFVNGKYYSKAEKSSFINLIFGIHASGKGISSAPWADIL